MIGLPKIKKRHCSRCGNSFIGGIMSKICENCYKKNHNKMVGIKNVKNKIKKV